MLVAACSSAEVSQDPAGATFSGSTDTATATTTGLQNSATEVTGFPTTGVSNSNGETGGDTGAETGSPQDFGQPDPGTTTGPDTDTSPPPDPVCGDGVLDPGEACDDGAANADDGACTLACAVAICGDMLVQAGVEDCDDGNAANDDLCVSGCKNAACGDGFVGPGEGCDDGNQVDNDKCGNDCAAPNCGDGKLQAGQGEECDDGNMVETDACLGTCVAAKCGDGVVQAGVEECDDANLDEADQCTATCKTPTCMDGAKNGAETDVDCGGDCGKCELGDACAANADCGEGLCIANTCKIAKSCKEIKEAAPNSMDGNYQIDPDDGGPINPLQVRCDMDAGMCGYTWIRFDDPALLNDQSAYAAKCAAVGMEVLVTRTKPHAQAFYDWNLSDQANLLNIFPKNNGAQSINNWQGICQGQPCSFWMTDNANGDVGCTNFEPNGDNNTLYRIYRRSAGCTLQGNWNDANNNIAIQGWVVCSPNDC